jgi:hypothetical protein
MIWANDRGSEGRASINKLLILLHFDIYGGCDDLTYYYRLSRVKGETFENAANSVLTTVKDRCDFGLTENASIL